MTQRINVEILGNASLFTRAGKGFAYRVTCGASSYLVDCGANIFGAMSPEELFALDGIFITHAHSDHVRYLADLAFYLQFSRKKPRRVRIITTERVHAQLCESLRETMDLTLDRSRRMVRQIAYEEFFDIVPIGPEPLYHITMTKRKRGALPLAVMTEKNRPVPPSRGKVFMHPKTGRLSMLLKDKATGAWVEPETFYDFSSRAFYKSNMRAYRNAKSGLRVTAVKKGVWHGMDAVGFLFQCGDTRVFFTGDTAADLDLWARLAGEFIDRPATRAKKFLAAAAIIGDVSNFVERVWSLDRVSGLHELYAKTAAFHDCGGAENIVHTGYPALEKLWTGLVGKDAPRSSLVLIHTQPGLASRFPIATTGQKYTVEGGRAHSRKK